VAGDAVKGIARGGRKAAAAAAGDDLVKEAADSLLKRTEGTRGVLPTSTIDPKASAVPELGVTPRLNRAGTAYPNIVDPRTGRPIAFPEGDLVRVPKAERVPWGLKERGDFIAEWYRRGYPTPPGGWARYDIHHVRPREFGGQNHFENLVPVERTLDHQQFNRFWEKF
jgi:hypothetical protein